MLVYSPSFYTAALTHPSLFIPLHFSFFFFFFHFHLHFSFIFTFHSVLLFIHFHFSFTFTFHSYSLFLFHSPFTPSALTRHFASCCLEPHVCFYITRVNQPFDGFFLVLSRQSLSRQYQKQSPVSLRSLSQVGIYVTLIFHCSFRSLHLVFTPSPQKSRPSTMSVVVPSDPIWLLWHHISVTAGSTFEALVTFHVIRPSRSRTTYFLSVVYTIPSKRRGTHGNRGLHVPPPPTPRPPICTLDVPSS